MMRKLSEKDRMCHIGAFDALCEENERLRQRLKRMEQERNNRGMHVEGESSRQEDRREEPKANDRKEGP